MQIGFWAAAVVVVVVAMAGAGFAAEATTKEGDPLATLKPGHPRLMVTGETWATLRKGVKDDPQMAAVFERTKGWADKIVADKKDRVSYTIIGPRLLGESRRALKNVQVLAVAYRVTGEKAYADLAISEMLTAAGFKDWNPSHFLDTAEMTAALGFGYDWLYDVLTPEQRKTIEQAIVTHGLKAGLKAYRGEASYGWWTKTTNNWSQVCNGGLAVGALAVADVEPELAREVLTSGLKAVRGAMAHFDPDGGWDEGPGYWDYTTIYTAYYLESLRTATGSMWGLDKTPGLANAGAFRMEFVGPSGKTFNFADAGDGAGSPAQMFWLAKTFDRPEYAWHHRQEKLAHPLDLLWWNGRGEDPDKAKVPATKLFHTIDVGFLRSSWQADATWVGFKGGDNGASHSHLDLGCFVLDAMGKRFVVDLGSDDYNMPGYFGKERYTYYRLKTEGHDTLVIDGVNQPAKAKAKVVGFSEKERAVVVDLTPGYPMATKVLRGFRLVSAKDGRVGLLVQDEVTAEKPVQVELGFHTQGKVAATVDGERITVDGKAMDVRVVMPGEAKLVVKPVTLEAPQKAPKDVTKMSVALPEKVKTLRLGVLFMPEGEAVEVKVEPLEKWPGWGK